ncbi:hypothetical protein [Serratia marcescens]|uniref:hypothetical protein n=1 Tax=Serratia marcescens TaxID=615 RepID=UPI004045D9BA
MSKLTTNFTPVAWLVMGSQGHYVEFDNEHGGIPLYTQEQASTIIQRTERLDAMLTESVQALKAAEQRIAELEARMATPLKIPHQDLFDRDEVPDVVISVTSARLRAQGFSIERELFKC